MPEAIVSKNEAVERVVAMFRARLESALRNGQRVQMSAREGTKKARVSQQTFELAPLAELLAVTEPDGSFTLHVYIEPRK